MRKLALCFLLVVAAFAAGPPSVTQWTPAQMQQIRARLAPKLSAQHVATERVADFGKYFFIAVLRTGSGQAELHERDADIFIVQSGEATLITGGTLVNRKTTQPNEVRGSAIEGGKETHLAPGDVVTIPAKVPHLVKLEPGKEILYLAVKVVE